MDGYRSCDTHMWYIYNGILPSYKKEWINPCELDEARACYKEQSKSGRKEILYTNTHLWILEKLYWRNYLQGRNTDTDIEDRLVDTEDDGEGGTDWQRPWNRHITICKETANGKLLDSTGSSTQRTLQSRRMSAGGWEVGLRSSGNVYTQDWFTLSYGRNQQDIVKKFSSV